MKIEGYLGLNQEESKLLLLLQEALITNDILNTDDEKLKFDKDEWYWEWKKNISRTLKQEIKEDFPQREFVQTVSALKQTDQIKKHLILLEATSFVPYYTLSDRGSGMNRNKTVHDENFRKRWINFIKFNFKEESVTIDDLVYVYSEATKEIMGKDWSNSSRNKSILAIAGAAVALAVTGGVAAPLIGGIIGSTFLGLSGAAATSAGLAFLGGGALAAGGFGMAGGTALIIGGGAILGGLVGANASGDNKGNMTSTLLAAFDTNYMLTNCAKMVTITKNIVTKSDKPIFISSLIEENEKNITNLEDLKNKSGKDFKKIFEKIAKEAKEELQWNDKIETGMKGTIEKNMGLLKNTNAILGKIMANQWPKEKAAR